MLQSHIFSDIHSYALFNFHIGAEDGEKYLAKISILLAMFVIILLVILAYFIYQNRRLKSSKANPENKSKDRNNSQDIYENPDDDDANYEQVENEESTYMYAANRTGKEENDYQLYVNQIEVHKDYVNRPNPRQFCGIRSGFALGDSTNLPRVTWSFNH